MSGLSDSFDTENDEGRGSSFRTHKERLLRPTSDSIHYFPWGPMVQLGTDQFSPKLYFGAISTTTTTITTTNSGVVCSPLQIDPHGC
jgi:hypothetical protein